MGSTAAIISAAADGAGVLSNVFGTASSAKSTKDTNATNLQIAQMNNEYNERQFDKQIQYNWDMWNAENEYNSPSAQMKRLSDAGLSPYSMLSESGTSATGGNVSPPTASPVQVQPFDATGGTSAISTSLQQIARDMANIDVAEAQKRKLNAEADNVHIDNQYKGMMALAQIQHMISGTKYNDSLTKRALQDFSFNEEANKYRLEQMPIQTRLLQSQLNSIEIQNSLGRKELESWDAKRVAELANLAADTQLKLATGQLTRTQAKTEIKRAILVERQGYGQKISNSVAERTANALVNREIIATNNAGLRYLKLKHFGTEETPHNLGGFNFWLDQDTPY